ncbi:MAG TPA: hypothetical protein VF366_06235 [Dehalococcoidia bacterium]|jgi:hypothetical protein
MEHNYKAWLKINDKPVAMNRFVEEFISHISAGAVASLKGGDKIQNFAIHGEAGNIVISVNGTEIPLTPFPNDLIYNTLIGIISSLKDVGDIRSFDIRVEVG